MEENSYIIFILLEKIYFPFWFSILHNMTMTDPFNIGEVFYSCEFAMVKIITYVIIIPVLWRS